jgi:hypothetical protein
VLKVLKDESQQVEFEKEVRVLLKLRHPSMHFDQFLLN